MNNAEILTKVKTALGITGDYQNDTLTIYIDDVKAYLKSAGVRSIVINNNVSIGCIVRGVSDLWNYGSGNVNLSDYFKQRAIQLTTLTNEDLEDADLIEKIINENGTYDPEDEGAIGYSLVTVNVPQAAASLQDKSVTPTQEIQEVTADEGFDGLQKVTVGRIPPEYVVPNGTLQVTHNGTYDVCEKEAVSVAVPQDEPPVLIEKSIIVNGTYNAADDTADGYSQVTVNVPAPVLQEKAVQPTESEIIVTAEVGYDGLSEVHVQPIVTEEKTVTAGTADITVIPTANKYIDKVIVQPTPSETETATPTTSMQTIQPTSGKLLASVIINAIPSEYIIPSGGVTVTENGTYDITDKSTVTVNVPDIPAVLQEKTVSPSNEEQNVTPDTGYDGLSEVIVNAATIGDKEITPTRAGQSFNSRTTDGFYGYRNVSVSGIPAEYIIPTGTLQITSNGTGDVSNYANVVVAVPQLDTSDADAPASEIVSGRTAYVDGVKLTGTLHSPLTSVIVYRGMPNAPLVSVVTATSGGNTTHNLELPLTTSDVVPAAMVGRYNIRLQWAGYELTICDGLMIALTEGQSSVITNFARNSVYTANASNNYVYSFTLLGESNISTFLETVRTLSPTTITVW